MDDMSTLIDSCLPCSVIDRNTLETCVQHGGGGGEQGHIIYIYYCTTGRAIRGNIQFEAGSIGPSAARDNTEAEN